MLLSSWPLPEFVMNLVFVSYLTVPVARLAATCRYGRPCNAVVFGTMRRIHVGTAPRTVRHRRLPTSIFGNDGMPTILSAVNWLTVRPGRAPPVCRQIFIVLLSTPPRRHILTLASIVGDPPSPQTGERPSRLGLPVTACGASTVGSATGTPDSPVQFLLNAVADPADGDEPHLRRLRHYRRRERRLFIRVFRIP